MSKLLVGRYTTRWVLSMLSMIFYKGSSIQKLFMTLRFFLAVWLKCVSNCIRIWQDQNKPAVHNLLILQVIKITKRLNYLFEERTKYNLKSNGFSNIPGASARQASAGQHWRQPYDHGYHERGNGQHFSNWMPVGRGLFNVSFSVLSFALLPLG